MSKRTVSQRKEQVMAVPRAQTPQESENEYSSSEDEVEPQPKRPQTTDELSKFLTSMTAQQMQLIKESSEKSLTIQTLAQENETLKEKLDEQNSLVGHLCERINTLEKDKKELVDSIPSEDEGESDDDTDDEGDTTKAHPMTVVLPPSLLASPALTTQIKECLKNVKSNTDLIALKKNEAFVDFSKQCPAFERILNAVRAIAL